MRQHGTRAKYQKERCRCVPCLDAAAKYERERRRKIARERYGIEMRPNVFVSADECRAHIDWLASQGIGKVALAQKSGVGSRTIALIRSGHRDRVLATTASRIMAVGKFDYAPGSKIDAAPYQRMWNELRRMGYQVKELERATGGKTRFRPLIRWERARRIEAVYAQLVRHAPARAENGRFDTTNVVARRSGCYDA